MASGSVFKRINKRGPVWGYVVELGRDPLTGKRDQRRVVGWPTKKAAGAELRKVLGELDAGAYVAPSAEAVGAYLLRWLAEVGPSWREATRYARAGVVRNRLIPHLGAVPLAKLTALQVQACYRALGESGLAPGTVAQTHAVLHGALAQAVAWRLVPRNVADRARLPANDPPEPAAWTAEEARAFLATAAGNDDALLYRLALDSGARLGECLALAWDDVDAERGTIAVRRTLTRTEGGGWRVGEGPKRAKGRRMIALAPPTVAALRTQRARQAARRLRLGPLWHDEGLVFDRGDGRACSPATVQQRFGRAVAAAGVPPLTFHGLRHTCATLLLAAGVHPKIVQERLGHKTIAMTLDRYSHVTMTMQQEAADRLTGLLGGLDDDPPAAGVTGT